jgi:phage tail P2-like protein
MSSRNHPTTLLPPNAQPAETALATAAARLSEVPVPVGTLWDPARCPASYLPWLAWALSVDNWDSTWPEAVKRQILAQSIAVHQRKGTVGAVRRAMAALGVKIDLQEWWETSPQGTPHTFSLTAYANANLSHDGEPVLSDRLYRALKKVVDATKPVRSHYEMTVAADFAQSLVLKDAMTAVTVGRLGIAPPVPVQPEMGAGLGMSAAATGLGFQRQSADLAAPQRGLHSGLGLAAGADSVGLARASAPARAPDQDLGSGLWARSGARGLGMARQQITPTLPLQQIQAMGLFTKAAARGLSVIRLSMELRA